MRRILWILLIAAVHLCLAVAFAIGTLDFSGTLFGIYPVPAQGGMHAFLSHASTVLMFPLGWVANSLPPGPDVLGWSLAILNSLAWAVGMYFLVAWVVRRRRALHHRV